jgi:hypothetical protein
MCTCKPINVIVGNRKEKTMSVSAKKRITDKRHQDKLDRMVIQPYKDRGAKIRQAAAAAGQSLQGYILQAVEEKMEREGK